MDSFPTHSLYVFPSNFTLIQLLKGSVQVVEVLTKVLCNLHLETPRIRKGSNAKAHLTRQDFWLHSGMPRDGMPP